MTRSENFKILIMLGKSGSGKGTQAEFLQKKFHLALISSGNLLRQRAKKEDFIGQRIKEIIGKGELIPTPVIFHLWLHRFEYLKNQRGKRGVIFEGSPRKLYEAHMLDEVFQFYHWEGGVRVLHLAISDREAMERLLKRARPDDKREAILERLKWFRKEVLPVIEYYRKKRLLVEVNGERAIETVRGEIFQRLKNFLL